MPEEPPEDLGAETELLDAGGPDDSPLPSPTWLGAIGQMIAATLVVVAVIALFIAAAVVSRLLLP